MLDEEDMFLGHTYVFGTHLCLWDTFLCIWDKYTCQEQTYLDMACAHIEVSGTDMCVLRTHMGLERAYLHGHIYVFGSCVHVYIYRYTYVFMVRKSMLATQTHVYETEYVMSAAHVSEHRGFRIKDRRLRGYVNGNPWAVAWDLDLGLSAAVKR